MQLPLISQYLKLIQIGQYLYIFRFSFLLFYARICAYNSHKARNSMKNRDIFIQDIVALGNEGEFSQIHDKSYSSEVVFRLLNHIKFLADYVEKEPTPPTAGEVIKRLTLNEFSLYTKGKPLTLDQYKTFIAGVNDIAKSHSPNIHLVIATLPVLWLDNTVHNAALYVQSPKKVGSAPTLHHFDKKIPSPIDKKYVNKFNKSLLLYREALVTRDYYDTPLSPNKILKDTPVKLNDPNQYCGAIKIETQSGESFISTVEICIEHSDRLGIEDVNKLIEQLKNHSLSIPEKATHVVTSNSVKIKEDHLSASQIIHADPNYKIANVKTVSTKNDKPIFGASLELVSYAPRPVSTLQTQNLTKKKAATKDGLLQEIFKLRTLTITPAMLNNSLFNRKNVTPSLAATLKPIIDSILEKQNPQDKNKSESSSNVAIRKPL